MSRTEVSHLPRWSVLVPPAAIVVLAGSWGRDLGLVLLVLVAAGLTLAVLAAVHHAEVALRVGEPFGTLILAVAVTVIEVALIVTLMLADRPDEPSSLARDTVFAAIMITCNGVVGLSLLVAQRRHHVLRFHIQSTTGALGVLATLVTLSLVLPTFTTSSPGPTFSGVQLAFAGVASLTLYGVYVFVQTIRHRDYFLPVEGGASEEHARPRPTGPPCSRSGCSWCAWLRWSGWPRPSRRASRTGWPPSAPR